MNKKLQPASDFFCFTCPKGELPKAKLSAKLSPGSIQGPGILGSPSIPVTHFYKVEWWFLLLNPSKQN